MSYTIPYSFIPGTKARAQEVNANFKYVLDSVDDLNTDKLNKSLSNLTQEGLDVIRSNVSFRNVGEIICSPFPLSDSGLHLLDGTLLSGSGTYGDFVDYIADLYEETPTANYFTTESDWQTSVTTYGVCGKFVYDSTNNTVRLPKITGIIEGTTDVTALGNLVQAGLPNITGSFALSNGEVYTPPTGAFYFGDACTGGAEPGTISVSGLKFDASRSSSIYGNSSKVQPQTVKVLYYIVVSSAIKTDIQVDIDNVTTDLNSKADTDLTNCTNQGKIFISGNAMPSSAFINLTLGASGSSYTAPSNGYFYLNKVVGSDWYYTSLDVYTSSDTFLYSVFADCYRTSPATIIVPVFKGQKVTVNYNASGVTNYFRFIYAKGSESEAA